jgi:hypothetical protein
LLGNRAYLSVVQAAGTAITITNAERFAQKVAPVINKFGVSAIGSRRGVASVLNAVDRRPSAGDQFAPTG